MPDVVGVTVFAADIPLYNVSFLAPMRRQDIATAPPLLLLHSDDMVRSMGMLVHSASHLRNVIVPCSNYAHNGLDVIGDAW